MLIEENQFLKNNYKLLETCLSESVYQQILELIEGSPSSFFHWKVIEEKPNVDVYLIEQNTLEKYTVCHLFSFDQIGRDFSYQSLPLKQMNFFIQFASRLDIT
ncbi:hypothetical protein SAMN05428961_1135 [Paenibacillus sp. OK060]|uniref:hypothetical protein n=1 Tax=Paenibacillus sp. OK060 TaxID=1881034 RepID=UPI000887928F|nr:hypothetical protein [Paenibacillus sp. OK060]SDM29388.1 hypothetical protein SAMN05428961_1135 [Paenibacillus sp. OK060]